MKADEAVVRFWLNKIKIASDPNSPFKGMVDLTKLFELSQHWQKNIYDAMTMEEQKQLADVYGKKLCDKEMSDA